MLQDQQESRDDLEVTPMSLSNQEGGTYNKSILRFHSMDGRRNRRRNRQKRLSIINGHLFDVEVRLKYVRAVSGAGREVGCAGG